MIYLVLYDTIQLPVLNKPKGCRVIITYGKVLRKGGSPGDPAAVYRVAVDLGLVCSN